MADSDYPTPYLDHLNHWHLELAMVRDLVQHILEEADGPEWLTSAAHIASSRFSHLVDSFPFPAPNPTQDKT